MIQSIYWENSVGNRSCFFMYQHAIAHREWYSLFLAFTMPAELKKEFVILDKMTHPFFELVKRSDGIVQLNTADDAFFTIKESKEFVTALRKITDGNPHLVLKVPGNHALVDKDSRTYMATEEALRYSIAEAVIIGNIAQRIVGNFYLKFNKPGKPVKLFDTKEQAESWLLNFDRST